MPKRKLTEEAQTYIVHSLACFDAPSEIVKEVKRLFGFDVHDAEIQRYHPHSASALKRGLSKKWVDLFEKSRAAYTAATSDVDIAHRVTRLRKLSRYIGQLEGGKSFVAAAQLLEMAEKMCGDYYTNRREITGNGGAPLTPPVTINLSALNLEELERFEAIALAAKAQGRTMIEIPFTPVEATSPVRSSR